LDLRGRKRWEAGEECIMRSFITCTLHQLLLGRIKENEMAGHVARMGDMRNAFKMFARKSEGKRPLERPRSRWEENID
jgi:hypothetical protein